jgi:hypothetical protein
MNLKERLLNFKVSFDETDTNKNKITKTDMYSKCKQFSDCIAGGLSTKNKDELVELVKKLIQYKSSLFLNTEDYKTFKFGDKTIKLDDEQHEIVTATPNNHIRIIAGAGSGKTTTILCRIKYLVDNYISPNKILVLTFNVDACQNLKNRIVELFGFDINVHIRTIDSFCAQIKWKYKLNNPKDFPRDYVKIW